MKGLGRLILVFLLALLPAAGSLAQLAVVANPRSGLDRLSREEAINIFLGRYRQLPSGLLAQPVDLPSGLPERAAFYRLLVNKDLAEINAYWARLVFSGRTAPPRQAGSVEDMLGFVAATPGAVGYLDRAKLDGRVRVVLELGP
jgi:hypothetical protein